MSGNFYTAGKLCVRHQVSIREIHEAAAKRGVAPALFLNDIGYFDEFGCAAIAGELLMSGKLPDVPRTFEREANE